MNITDICQLARENGVKISFEPAGRTFISIPGVRMDIRKDDYTLSTMITPLECDREECIEYLIESRMAKIKEYEEARKKCLNT